MTLDKIGHVLAYSLTMIVALEQSLPQSGLGQTKKQIALNGIETALKATAATSAAFAQQELAQVTGMASTFIDQTVALLNKVKAGPFGQATSAGKAT